ncbi:heme-binding protein [Sphingomonas sp. C3-2]|uniref:heme-binding protein n=1 Tax=Sphingomonas sp. C3-2 TaxID=3062169 RepID=UPI00294B6A0E|nr:heme-binding protein [Sphingomonas sp. C3-2]WOK36553.1 heme-binding protein [Sphingomonas sp. C3-2]
MTIHGKAALLLGAAMFVLSGCGGGGSDGGGSGQPTTPTTPPATGGLYTAPAQEALTSAEVQQVIAQAAAEAQARGRPANIAVVDRVGNVLAVFVMNGANPNLAVPRPTDGSTNDLQGVDVPGAVAGAIAKAITGAYLSSSGNAFSTRTASQIVQQHFPPAPSTVGLESGPLFGVQFSQLPCSDLAARFQPAGGATALIGPKRSPLGLSADPGGLPLYKNGVVVGGIGVMADGEYGFDPNILDTDEDDEEFIALAGTTGFAAPETIRADRITVDGTALRFSDAMPTGLKSNPASAAGFAAINGALGALVSVAGYFEAAAGVRAGTAYGTEASGIRRAGTGEFSNSDAFVLTNGSGANRYPIRAGSDTGAVSTPLSAAEVRAILEEAFSVMSRARAQIRQPLDSRAQVTISIVDTHGVALGIVRSPDAPIFGTDVSLQKARTAMFFSNAQAGTQLLANPSADVQSFVAAARTFFNDPAALTGKYAFSDRANGNVSRPYFPDGEVGRPNGPFSRPIASFNPFSTGLQSALIKDNVLTHVGFILGANPDTPQRCTATPDVAAAQNRLQNGIQIFPGSVPIYRGSELVGGIGVSGDGIDQDDMISFLGLHNAGLRVGGIGNAAPSARADQITVPVGSQQVRLRYINCPFAPFLGSSDQNVCQGL